MFSLMSVAFKKAGLEQGFRAVGDGREAIAYLTGDGAYGDRGQYPVPSMILLDLNLPGLSGFDVLKWVRGRPEFRELPVVIFSSSEQPEDKARASELGANGYLEKPKSGLLFAGVVERLKQLRSPEVNRAW